MYIYYREQKPMTQPLFLGYGLNDDEAYKDSNSILVLRRFS